MNINANVEIANALANINAKIERNGHTPAVVAIAAGLPVAPIVRKLAGNGELTVSEIICICRTINLPVIDIFNKTINSQDRPCLIAACTYESHEWVHGEQNGPCENHRFAGRNDDCDYIVWVQKWPDEGWFADGEISGASKGEPGLELIDSYRRDFAQAVAIAARLNESTK